MSDTILKRLTEEREALTAEYDEIDARVPTSVEEFRAVLDDLRDCHARRMANADEITLHLHRRIFDAATDPGSRH